MHRHYHHPADKRTLIFSELQVGTEHVLLGLVMEAMTAASRRAKAAAEAGIRPADAGTGYLGDCRDVVILLLLYRAAASTTMSLPQHHVFVLRHAWGDAQTDLRAIGASMHDAKRDVGSMDRAWHHAGGSARSERLGVWPQAPQPRPPRPGAGVQHHSETRL